MLISSGSCRTLEKKINSSCDRIYCKGLFLSARWFVMSQVAVKGMHLVVLPDKDTAEYCASDLYNLVEGDRIFFLPESGKNVERSNYKSSLAVQRTAAIGRIMSGNDNEDLGIIVSYPDALQEPVPTADSIRNSVLKISRGDDISHDRIMEILSSEGFEKVDFVSAPGQYAIRGSIVDIFSYSWNYPYRLSFWGDEVEKINIFDCNTQLSVSETDSVEIVSDLMSSGDKGAVNILELFPESALVWLDSSDMYKDREFFGLIRKFRSVYIDTPLSLQNEEQIQFAISPQPSFNKNFELLAADVRSRIESGYKVFIYGDKTAQLERIKSILSQNGGLIPEFVSGKTVHQGFVDSEDKVCCYSDHEIFDRFQRVSIRRSVEKSEQLTINDLNSFNIGDYVVHIDHGVGIFGGLVRMRDDKGRMHEVVKITYKDGDVVFVSVHALNKISRFRSRDGEPPRINKLGSKTWSTLKSSAKSNSRRSSNLHSCMRTLRIRKARPSQLRGIWRTIVRWTGLSAATWASERRKWL